MRRGDGRGGKGQVEAIMQGVGSDDLAVAGLRRDPGSEMPVGVLAEGAGPGRVFFSVNSVKRGDVSELSVLLWAFYLPAASARG